jgi:hypothetical protein
MSCGLGLQMSTCDYLLTIFCFDAISSYKFAVVLYFLTKAEVSSATSPHSHHIHPHLVVHQLLLSPRPVVPNHMSPLPSDVHPLAFCLARELAPADAAAVDSTRQWATWHWRQARGLPFSIKTGRYTIFVK